MGKNGVLRRRELGEERKPATYFYRKREHKGTLGAASYLPRAARREPEKDSGAVEKGPSRNAACLLMSTGASWDPQTPTLQPPGHCNPQTQHRKPMVAPPHHQEGSRPGH